MNPGPPALDVSTLPLGYRGGGVSLLIINIFYQVMSSMAPSSVQSEILRLLDPKTPLSVLSRQTQLVLLSQQCPDQVLNCLLEYLEITEGKHILWQSYQVKKQQHGSHFGIHKPAQALISSIIGKPLLSRLQKINRFVLLIFKIKVVSYSNF